jgi:predicted O-methyltransferase YrrM
MEGKASGVSDQAPDAPSTLGMATDPDLLPPEHHVDHQKRRAAEEGWHWQGDMASEGEVSDLIHAFILSTKPEKVVETGTYVGHTAKTISEALTRNGTGHLWTVENDPSFTQHYRNMEMSRTTFVDADSPAWCASNDCPSEIDFAFVDSGHPPVRLKDVQALYPKMREGGLLLVHDVEFYLPDFYASLRDILGAAQLYLPTLHGLAIWQV